MGQVLVWQETIPGRHWLLNATGGLKLMSAGMMALADLDGIEVVYRELSQWYRITNEAGLSAVPLNPGIDPGITDTVQVLDLVRSQWDSPTPMEWTAQPPQSLNVARVLEETCRNGWNWRAAFLAAGEHVGNTEGAGFLFERLVAGALRDLGIRQIARGLALQGGRDQEVDLVANWGGRLLVIDCKLRTPEEEDAQVEGITSQIRQAATTRRSLGGLNTKLLLARPNRPFSEAERLLAEAYGLEVIDANDA